MTELSKSEYEHKQMSNAIAALSMDAVQAANSGHPGMPMGMADAATVLFSKFLKFNPTDPNWRQGRSAKASQMLLVLRSPNAR